MDKQESAQRCPKCNRVAKSDFDPDVGKWWYCDPCDYQWSVSELPQPTNQDEYQGWPRGRGAPFDGG